MTFTTTNTSSTADEIDQAFDRFSKIFNSISVLDRSAWTEADTRLKIIDSILFDVLGWGQAESTEATANG